MSDSYLSLAQLATINDRNAVDYGVSDLFDDAPLLKALAATVASNGTNHKYLKQTAAPVVGFRDVNVGLANSVSTDVLVTAALKVLDASFAVDKALADSYFKGPEAYLAREGQRHLRAAFFAAEKQFINGTGSDASGFSGFANATTLDGLSDTATVVNAAGTTAATGSSVYLIRTNNDGTDVEAVIGNKGEIVIDTPVVQRIDDGSGGHYTAYHVPIQSWMGLQMGSVASVIRICNLTADSGKGLTDALIYQALSLFPASRMPNIIVGNRRSRMQLQKSRTATNATGAPAPMPTEVEGIPYITTDAILSTEALLT